MSGLHGVADHLSSRAKELKDSDADAFGRSAFNRYYYATYLTVRDLLGTLDAAWKKERHSTIPGLLEGAVLKHLKHWAKQQERVGALSRSKKESLIRQATQASGDIASILRVAYEVRVASDYDPECKLVFDRTGFALLDHTDAEAKNWLTRVERQKGVLISVSKELGIV